MVLKYNTILTWVEVRKIVAGRRFRVSFSLPDNETIIHILDEPKTETNNNQDKDKNDVCR
jgi:hypothetical protein